MKELKTDRKQDVQRMVPSLITPLECTIHLFLLGMLSLGFVGHFALQRSWPGLIFAHTAALGIMGFYGCLAGAIARKKGYGYWMAFRLGFFIPIIIGLIAAIFLVPAGDKGMLLSCGGWYSLSAGIIVVLVYTFIRPRKSDYE